LWTSLRLARPPITTRMRSLSLNLDSHERTSTDTKNRVLHVRRTADSLTETDARPVLPVVSNECLLMLIPVSDIRLSGTLPVGSLRVLCFSRERGLPGLTESQKGCSYIQPD
jgi:hypothetical protein